MFSCFQGTIIQGTPLVLRLLFVIHLFVLRFAVKPDTLMDMVEHMTEKVALVHQMPFTCDREGFAATYEKVLLLG